MDEQKENQPDRAPRLTIDQIERLDREAFDALPEPEKRRYFGHMDRENAPTAWEFYGYAEEFGYPTKPHGRNETEE